MRRGTRDSPSGKIERRRLRASVCGTVRKVREPVVFAVGRGSWQNTTQRWPGFWPRDSKLTDITTGTFFQTQGLMSIFFLLGKMLDPLTRCVRWYVSCMMEQCGSGKGFRSQVSAKCCALPASCVQRDFVSKSRNEPLMVLVLCMAGRRLSCTT